MAASGDLDINTDITIMGNGAANTIIQGSSNAAFAGNMGDKILGINPAGLNTTLNASISGLTVRFTRNDIAVNPSFTQTGGAMDIFLTGTGAMPGPTTTLTNCTFDSNANLHSYGGAINIDSGSLTAPTTNVFRGTVQFTGCTISNNDTLTTAPADNPPSGGGVNLFGDIHNVTFTDCAITANGGGINMRHSNGGLVTLTNSDRPHTGQYDLRLGDRSGGLDCLYARGRRHWQRNLLEGDIRRGSDSRLHHRGQSQRQCCQQHDHHLYRDGGERDHRSGAGKQRRHGDKCGEAPAGGRARNRVSGDIRGERSEGGIGVDLQHLHLQLCLAQQPEHAHQYDQH